MIIYTCYIYEYETACPLAKRSEAENVLKEANMSDV